jgi:hypothetical protein
MSFTFVKPMHEVLIAPLREIADANYEWDATRAVLWQWVNPYKICLLMAIGFGANRYLKMRCAKRDWAEKGVFKQRRVPVHERWGPPPPRKYDDNGNLI